MGILEFSLFNLSEIIAKEFNDLTLSSQVKTLAGACHNIEEGPGNPGERLFDVPELVEIMRSLERRADSYLK